MAWSEPETPTQMRALAVELRRPVSRAAPSPDLGSEVCASFARIDAAIDDTRERLACFWESEAEHVEAE